MTVYFIDFGIYCASILAYEYIQDIQKSKEILTLKGPTLAVRDSNYS